VEVKVVERYVFFAGTDKEILLKHNNEKWRSVDIL
jgi:hypothetical protein